MLVRKVGLVRLQVTHWQHPRFHAYFPAGNSYPSILGDMLGDAIGCVGFSWVRTSTQAPGQAGVNVNNVPGCCTGLH